MTQPQPTTEPSLEKLFSLQHDDETAIHSLIAELCNSWDRKARTINCHGFLRDSHNAPTDLETAAGWICKLLREALQSWHSNNMRSVGSHAVTLIGLICQRLDRRFLWCLLDRIVNEVAKQSFTEADNTLIQAVCRTEPDLPFRSATNWPPDQNTSFLGKESSLAKSIRGDDKAKILEALLMQDDTIRQLQSAYQSQAEETTIFYQAIKLRKPEAVEVLLRICPHICRQVLDAEQQDTMLLLNGSRDQDRALEAIARQIVDKFPDLTHSGDLLALVLEHPNAELAKIYYSSEAVFSGDESYMRVQELIECQPLEDDELLELPDFRKACLKIMKKDTLLHLAIKARRQNLVEFLASETNGVSTIDSAGEGGKYALWYNNHPEKWTRQRLDAKLITTPKYEEMHLKRESMRKTLIASIIRKCEPEKIDEIIDASDVREYSFDITEFGKHDLSLSDFIVYFMNHEQQKSKLHRKLKFEVLLKYVQFPKIASTLGDAAHEHDEIREVLDWLWKKGVRVILRLSVPDRLWGPHNERCISEIASTFQVEELDWRCQDLSFTCLAELIETKDKQQRRATDHLRVLHLYSSGKSAVHRYWLGPDGLADAKVFPKLERAVLYIIKDNLPEPLIVSALKELRRLRSELFKQHPRIKISIEIKRYSWHSQQKFIRGDSIQEITSRAFPPPLSQFLKQYRSLQFAARRVLRTKVAILDNGIMAMYRSGNSDPSSETQSASTQPDSAPQTQTNISHQVFKGKSFVHNVGQRKSSWFVATNPHGSQMAALICALDPHSEILIAKVADHHADVYPDRVAKMQYYSPGETANGSQAIRWAIKIGADIISMSFVCGHETTALQNAIKEAHQKNIVLFTSCHDEGLNRSNAYPADYRETQTIAACTPLGDLIYNTDKEKYQYRFLGLNVFVGRIAQLASSETVTGSSVATAIAAGMASLILSCLRYCNRQIPGLTADVQTNGNEQVRDFANTEMSSSDDSDSGSDSDSTVTQRAQQISSTTSNHQAVTHDPPNATNQPDEPLGNQYGQDRPRTIVLPRSAETTWRMDVVNYFFTKMASDKYVALNQICGLGGSGIDLETVDFENEIVRKWFCDEFMICARDKPWRQTS